ncbi:ECF transporter S component [Tissierella carlieri]|jgi:energy-coupling factor transport system substrate-specific component|uniref:ECF transporter S component n=1 Tax=Tissierella carlieri TaxID=689904 RepID=UPI001C0F53E8|nr:ECF transporter S component [Tissierella carlieri]MBU5312463.1 ECF transporter S component [Tissierella carlieri]
MSKKYLESDSLNPRTLVSAIIILLLIPITIFFGMYFLNDRKYYFISVLIIIYTMIPFIMIFESQEPRARELVLIAVLTAIAVAGRGAFYMIPQFKPVVAIVIITGVSLGAESGFLVGAMTGFVSNFFFGQGPWTPWQMFCFGIIGFLAGILFQKRIIKKTRFSLCIYGGLSTLFIYGGIIDIGSLLIFTSNFSWKALLATYISGFWFNIVHSISTVFFLFFISQPMIEKLDRVKIKYGLIEIE